MLATLRRLRVLTAWLAVCVVGGPAASAMCAHVEAAPAAPPCHETGEDMAMEGMAHEKAPADHHDSSETACFSACCAGLDVRAEATVVVPASALAPVVRVVEIEPPVSAPVVAAVAARDHPPPGPDLLEIGKLLL